MKTFQQYLPSLNFLLENLSQTINTVLDFVALKFAQWLKLVIDVFEPSKNAGVQLLFL